jgi:hypothetical protein
MTESTDPAAESFGRKEEGGSGRRSRSDLALYALMVLTQSVQLAVAVIGLLR